MGKRVAKRMGAVKGHGDEAGSGARGSAARLGGLGVARLRLLRE
jgi:hypothetical protein